MSDSLQRLWRSIAVALAGLLVAAGAVAQSGRQPREGDYAPPPRQFADPDRAANAAREATGGRVLGVQGADQDGQPGYRVRILEQNGRVRSLHFDPASGKVRD
ncbi:MAG: PepSY domain-containing protein [Candidatus Competibacteraceae bacterium]